MSLTGGFTKSRNLRPNALPYPTMTVAEIAALPVEAVAAPSAHLWLWTANQFLPHGFDLMKRWGFKYMVPIQWVKPSGLGCWWIHRTQTLLFGYRGKLDMRTRLKPNVIFGAPKRHSEKPAETYDLIEAISHPSRLELFARKPRDGWTAIGNEIDGRSIHESLHTART